MAWRNVALHLSRRAICPERIGQVVVCSSVMGAIIKGVLKIHGRYGGHLDHTVDTAVHG